MKGLLLKDWYMTRKYFRSFALLMVVFWAVSIFTEENFFMMIYPCVLAGMIPVNLMSYDSRSRWEEYAGTLPYTRAQIVSAKYLLGLAGVSGAVLITGACQALRLALNGGFRWEALAPLLAILLVLGFVTPAISMPFLFSLGPEKGRLFYLVFIGVACGSGAVLSISDVPGRLEGSWLLPLLALAGAAVYGLSWYVSVLLYRRREL